MQFNFDSRFSKKIIINCQLSFGLNVLVFNENKYFCLKIFSACFFLLNCLTFNIKTINSCRQVEIDLLKANEIYTSNEYILPVYWAAVV